MFSLKFSEFWYEDIYTISYGCKIVTTRAVVLFDWGGLVWKEVNEDTFAIDDCSKLVSTEISSSGKDLEQI